MPFLQEPTRSRGISLPPSGWALAILLVVYIFTGLIGHDPWKHDDAISIGMAYDVFSNGNWLTPQLAGQPNPDAPLYYWTAALTAHLFSWLLPVHDAARLTSGIFTLLALQFILLAARELHGREHAAAAPLVLAGSIGFLFHAHEAQPMLAALTAHAAAYWALALLPRRPLQGALILGTATGLGFLANGLLPLITLAPAMLVAMLLCGDCRKKSPYLLLAALIALLIASAWLIPLQIATPELLSTFFHTELRALAPNEAPLPNGLKYLNLLLWYAWPALPLAAWSLWTKRRTLRQPAFALPMLSFLSVLLILSISVSARSAQALLMLPPLVLLASPAVGVLRRGAANAFDWFGMMTFTFMAAVAWIVWSAMVFGWPTRLARQAVRLEPGFIGHFETGAFVCAMAATLIWLWLIVTSPRSPFRGITHWMAGLTLFWVLIATLWMPWVNYGKTYRPLSASLSAALPAKIDCIINANLPKSILASLDYFDGITTTPQKDATAGNCSWLVAQGDTRKLNAIRVAGWKKVWEGKRPGDRRESEKFHLFQRMPKTKAASTLPELNIEEGEQTTIAP